MIRKMICFALVLVPQLALAQDRERALEWERGSSDIRKLEKESELQRDLLGRKIVVDPDSKIDPGSLYIQAAPGSTVMIRARQFDKGVQTTESPLYKNVEMPNDIPK